MIYKNAKALEVLACIFDSFLRSEKAQPAPDIPEVFMDIFDDISQMPSGSPLFSCSGICCLRRPRIIWYPRP